MSKDTLRLYTAKEIFEDEDIYNTVDEISGGEYVRVLSKLSSILEVSEKITQEGALFEREINDIEDWSVGLTLELTEMSDSVVSNIIEHNIVDFSYVDVVLHDPDISLETVDKLKGMRSEISRNYIDWSNFSDDFEWYENDTEYSRQEKDRTLEYLLSTEIENGIYDYLVDKAVYDNSIKSKNELKHVATTYEIGYDTSSQEIVSNVLGNVIDDIS